MHVKNLQLLFLFVIKILGNRLNMQFRSTSQAPTHHRIDGVVDNEVNLSVTLNKHAHHSFNSNSLEQSL